MLIMQEKLEMIGLIASKNFLLSKVDMGGGGILGAFIFLKKFIPLSLKIFIKKIYFYFVGRFKIDPYDLLNSEYFSYGNARVMIRILATKKD